MRVETLNEVSALSSSGAEQRSRHDADAVLAATGLGSDANHNDVEEIVTKLVAQPHEVLDVLVFDLMRELYLDATTR